MHFGFVKWEKKLVDVELAGEQLLIYICLREECEESLTQVFYLLAPACISDTRRLKCRTKPSSDTRRPGCRSKLSSDIRRPPFFSFIPNGQTVYHNHLFDLMLMNPLNFGTIFIAVPPEIFRKMAIFYILAI